MSGDVDIAPFLKTKDATEAERPKICRQKNAAVQNQQVEALHKQVEQDYGDTELWKMHTGGLQMGIDICETS